MKLFLIAVLCTLSAFGQGQLALSGTSVKPKTQATLNLTLSGAAGQNIAGLQFSMQLPAGVTAAMSVGPAATAASKTLDCAQNGANLICLVTGLNQNVLADGVVASLKFVPQNSGNLSFGLSDTLGASVIGDAVTVGAVATFPFTVTPICDVNSDGITDAADVTAVKTLKLTGGTCTVDTDSDGKCTIVDVRRVENAAQGQACKTN